METCRVSGHVDQHHKRILIMIKRFKVVKRKTRKSAIVNGNSEFALTYLPGIVVTAKPETMGIMTFTRYFEARKWVTYLHKSNYVQFTRDALMIIKVLTIGHGYEPEHISYSSSAGSLREYYNGKNMHPAIPPYGTICYSSVKVLD